MALVCLCLRVICQAGTSRHRSPGERTEGKGGADQSGEQGPHTRLHVKNVAVGGPARKGESNLTGQHYRPYRPVVTRPVDIPDYSRSLHNARSQMAYENVIPGKESDAGPHPSRYPPVAMLDQVRSDPLAIEIAGDHHRPRKLGSVTQDREHLISPPSFGDLQLGLQVHGIRLNPLAPDAE